MLIYFPKAVEIFFKKWRPWQMDWVERSEAQHAGAAPMTCARVAALTATLHRASVDGGGAHAIIAA